MRLTSLRLGHNKLSGRLPGSLTRLAGLTSLDLAWNQLTGTVPMKFGSMTALRQLSLSHNKVSDIPRKESRMRSCSSVKKRLYGLLIQRRTFNTLTSVQLHPTPLPFAVQRVSPEGTGLLASSYGVTLAREQPDRQDTSSARQHALVNCPGSDIQQPTGSYPRESWRNNDSSRIMARVRAFT